MENLGSLFWLLQSEGMFLQRKQILEAGAQCSIFYFIAKTVSEKASDWIWDVFLQQNPTEFLDVIKREVEKAISLSQVVDLISLSRFVVLTADAVR